ncbi:MAG: GPR endopeptidase, partial [Blautia sp.]
MLENYRIRTDLALETTERFKEDNVEIRGVVLRETYDEEKDIRTTVVKIETENGAKAMGRPQGTYITIEAPNLSVPDEDYHREVSEEIAHHLRQLLNLEEETSILVVGLGNREITPDALGPGVVG